MENKKETIEEPVVQFKVISDKSILNVRNEELDVTLVEISGYDLQINFNMDYLHSLEDVEAAVGGISTLFRNAIMDKLLEYKKQNV